MSDLLPNYPQKNLDDRLHLFARMLMTSIPVLGGAATEIFNELLTAPIEKRKEDWLLSVFTGLLQRLGELETRNLFDDEIFVSTFLQATRQALINHNKENIEALRNAVLNSALPQAPDEIRQKMFVEWAGEMTAWHLRILKLFATQRSRIPSVDLGSSNWMLNNILVDELANAIEEYYPDMKNNLSLYFSILPDLYQKGLLANLVPIKGSLTAIETYPVVSPIGMEFLRFIQEPPSLATTP